MSDLILKRPNRWLITFDTPYDKIPSYALSKSSRPKWVVSKTAKHEYDGKWSDIEIILSDPIAPSTTEGLMNGLRNNKKKKKPISYSLEMLGPVGDTVEKWLISGYIKELDFGDLDYSNDSLIMIKLVIAVDNVVLEF